MGRAKDYSVISTGKYRSDEPGDETSADRSALIQVRAASIADAEAIAAIYAHHVLKGTASFDDEPPTTGFWREKIAAIKEKDWPFLVATVNGQVVGYAYATQFRDRAAYAFTCEDSIYVHPEHLGKGIGGRLLSALISAARAAGFQQMIAVIGGAEPASVALHRACSFVEAGRMKSVGFKFGRWLDSLYMQRSLAVNDGAPL